MILKLILKQEVTGTANLALQPTTGCCHLANWMARSQVHWVAAPRVLNSLPQHLMSAPSLVVFRSRLKTHLFMRCFPWLYRSLVVPEKWHVNRLCYLLTYLLTYLRWPSLLKVSWYKLPFSRTAAHSRCNDAKAQTASEIIEFSPALIAPPTRGSSLGNRAFLVAAARAWNSLPSTVTAASTLIHSVKPWKLIYSPHLSHHLSYITCIPT